MSTPSNSPTPDPIRQDPNRARGENHDRGDGAHARDEAFRRLRQWRPHLIARFQHSLLDWILERGDTFVPDVADEFESPPNVHRAFIGVAVSDLYRAGMISPLDEVRAARQGGRHGNLYRVWRFAPGISGAKVREWKQSRPIPPPPATDETPGDAP